MSTEQDDRAGLPSASGAERFYMCAGSWQAEQASPEPPETEVAAQGTLIHQALETGELEHLGADEETIALKLSEMEKQAILDWQPQYPEDKEAHGPTNFGREDRLWIRDRETMTPIASAKPDSFLVYKIPEGQTGLVWDAKTGFLPVTPAGRNIQMRWQALALWHENPKIVKVRVQIAQSRFKSADSKADYDLPLLQRAEQEFLFNLWRSQQKDAPRSPGPWCRSCRARAMCPENAAMALLPVTSISALSGLPKDKIAERVNLLPVKDLAFLRSRKSLIEGILEAVNTRLKSLPAEELKAVGLELFTPKGNREVSDINGLYEIMLAHGVTAGQFLALCKVPVGETEAMLTSKLVDTGDFKTKKAAQEEASQIIAPVIQRKDASPRLKEIA